VNPTIPPKKNPYDRYDFQYNKDNYLVLQNVESYPGVDVSAYQGDIDWAQVKASGIDFAIIRLGYRGYESGKLVEDTYARKNLEGSAEAGLKVGAYFFSQALNIKEVDEELEFMLDILGEQYLAMPLVLDWEIPTANARSARMNKETLTQLQLHFCKKVSDMGYKPMIYFNWHQSENLYDLHAMEEYPFWLALYQDRMTYPWDVEMWQYTSSGKVPGIPGPVDINVYMPY
jgi:GH25 family lysozyme M1 (1,4-beta-N-acetylmuramidase)